MKRLFNILARIPIIGKIFNRYEAAWSGWGERSWLQQSLQDARFDIDAATRQEIQRRHRYWVSNSSLIQKLRSLRIQFAVGPCGLHVTPNSSNEDWNKTRHDSFSAWSKSPDLTSWQSLHQCTLTWAGQDFDDGEFFIYKTKDAKGNPAIQTIEAHRVKTPPKQNIYRGMMVYDGVAVDANGRPQFYAVATGPQFPQAGYDPSAAQWLNGAGEIFVWIKASDMIHKFESLRPGQLRGIPKGFACLNELHDISDLHKLEMQCAKMAAEIALVETNPTGELSTSANRKNKISLSTSNNAGSAVTKATWVDYNVSFGGKKIGMKQGDSLKNFMIDRPTATQESYWCWKVAEVCSGYDTPVMIAFPAATGKMQGTAVRAELDICANAFRRHFERIKEALEEIYQWQGVWANDFDLSQDGEIPDDHHQVVIRPPRSPNVDIGYTAKALEIELRLGVKTIQDVYAEKQQNWRTQLTQIAEFIAFTKDLCDSPAFKGKVTPGQITSLAVEQAIEDPTSKPDKPEGDSNESSPEAQHQNQIYV